MNHPERDADDWTEALAGRPRDGADAVLNAEAALLRAAIRREPAPAAALTQAEAAAQRAALLARARSDPRLAAGRGCLLCGLWQRFAARSRRPGFAGAAGLVLAGVLALAVILPRHDAPQGPAAGSELRGGGAAEGVQRLRAADPLALRERIAAELAREGVAVLRYERNGRLGLDAELPQPLPPAVGDAIKRHGLALPPSGGLAVEIEPDAP